MGLEAWCSVLNEVLKLKQEPCQIQRLSKLANIMMCVAVSTVPE